MNILVIGNGFDLAHGLPTKYTDFLWFCRITKEIFTTAKEMDYKLFKKEYLNKSPINEKIKELLAHLQYCMFNNRSRFQYVFPHFCELYKMICNNIWVAYFELNPVYQNENWIDFESEISRVIQAIDHDMQRNNYDLIQHLSNGFFTSYLLHKPDIKTSYYELKDKLENDLNQLIRAFEIYLTEYVEKIDIPVVSPDIERIIAISYETSREKRVILTKVLSFNYTNIYEKVYLSKYSVRRDECIDYIHGKASISNTVESNGMVLGIDEYLPLERRNKDTDFIAFKKFYQRIYKKTGCKYKEWVNRIQEDYYEYIQKQIDLDGRAGYATNDMETVKSHLALKVMKDQKCKKHYLYIFGHSLDITDRDILRDLILNDNVFTTIYYPNKNELGRKIANLVRVIGQDELIRRTGGNTKRIEFKLQEPMERVRQNIL